MTKGGWGRGDDPYHRSGSRRFILYYWEIGTFSCGCRSRPQGSGPRWLKSKCQTNLNISYNNQIQSTAMTVSSLTVFHIQLCCQYNWKQWKSWQQCFHSIAVLALSQLIAEVMAFFEVAVLGSEMRVWTCFSGAPYSRLQFLPCSKPCSC